ncbi:hypothetical protein FA727_01040 [Robertmurraya kyonggiensis]|uniref:Uncharacterized protein n=1 Tax=Robertmurraya kyonggiensis TaxID=1037680 RepID=A0A4U1D6I0_9BACI|nr:hypothetical protein FA727_01040 [Robertmurraya kyonggiensis]
MSNLNSSAFNVKLTDRDVYKILYLNKVEGLQPNQIEKLFPVSKVTIRNIVQGKSRKDCYSLFMQYKDSHLNEFKKLSENL